MQYAPEQAEQRGQIADSYADLPTETLLEMLERGEYTPPMDRSMGDSTVVRELVIYRRHELDEFRRRRLRAVAPRLHRYTAAKLDNYLALTERDQEYLVAEWRRNAWEHLSGFEYVDLLDCLSALPVDDEEVIADWVRHLAENRCCKGAVMIALARLGPAKAPTAAATIRSHIPESHSPDLRERVLLRLEDPNLEWQPCPECRTGWTRFEPPLRRGQRQCPECYGLMIVPKPKRSL